MDKINQSIAQAYLNMYEASCNSGKKMKREAWVPEAIADEDVADFMGAAAAAAKAGKKEFKFGDKTYKVTMKKDTAKKIAEAICEECGCDPCECTKTESVDEAVIIEGKVRKLKNAFRQSDVEKYMKIALKDKGNYKGKKVNWNFIDADVYMMMSADGFDLRSKSVNYMDMFDAAADKLDPEMKESVDLEESPEQPRAKGEQDFKKMHDDNIEVKDEEEDDEKNFDNIKKSADAIKK